MPLFVPSGSASSPTWTAYTPTLGATVSNPTLGAGSAVGRYTQNGKIVHCMLDIVFGVGMAAGSGVYVILLPVTISSSVPNNAVLGSGRLYDSSSTVSALTCGFIFSADHTRVQMIVNGTGTTVTNAVPWTWAANDEIRLILTYEAA